MGPIFQEQLSYLTRMSWNGRFAQNEVAGFRPTSDCVGFVLRRLETRQSNAELSQIEDDGQTTY